MRKQIGFLIMIIILFSLSACNFTPGEEKYKERNYIFLNISKSKEHGGEILNPGGTGSFAYRKGDIVNIELEINQGYTFSDWQGEDGSEVVQINDGDLTKWKIIMNKNKKIIAGFSLDKFLMTSTEPADKAIDIPFNISQIKIYFNNALGISDASFITLTYLNDSNEEVAVEIEAEIEDNCITLKIDDYLQMGKEYKVQFPGSIWDEDNNILQDCQAFSFSIKEDTLPPEVPNVGITSNNNTVQLVWERCQDNPYILLNIYAQKYNIYKRANDDEDFVKIATVNDENYQNKEGSTQFSYQDNNVELDSNIYYYYLSAVDEQGNESEPSVIVNTNTGE